jgi:hypothetical protein
LWIHNKKFHSTSNNNDINLHKSRLDYNKNLINKKDFDKLQCYYYSIFLKNVQIIDNTNYQCNICNKEFINKSSIYKHKKMYRW